MHREYLIDWRLYTCGANGQIYSYYFKKCLKGWVDKNGYVRVRLKCVDGRHRDFFWHRIIWTFFYGTIPEGMEINHISEVKTENMLSNLECVSHLANIRHGTGIERSAVKRRGVPKSEETKRKIAESHKGLKLSEESKRKITEFRLGVSQSEETRKKISETLKGRIISEETRKKISETLKGRIISEEHKRK